MLRKSITNIAHIVFVLLAVPVCAAEVSGKVIAYSCNACHGSDGQSATVEIPSLKAQAADAMAEKLLDFKYDKQASTIMGRIAKGYTDAELKAVAKYFSRLQ